MITPDEAPAVESTDEIADAEDSGELTTLLRGHIRKCDKTLDGIKESVDKLKKGILPEEHVDVLTRLKPSDLAAALQQTLTADEERILGDLRAAFPDSASVQQLAALSVRLQAILPDDDSVQALETAIKAGRFANKWSRDKRNPKKDTKAKAPRDRS